MNNNRLRFLLVETVTYICIKMLKKLVNIFLFFIIIIITVSCIKNNNAQDMIFNFYKQYLSSSITETERQELIKKYCTKNMLKTLDVLYSFDEEEGFIIGIDYDPFLNAQDFFPIENLKIEPLGKNKYKISWNNTDKNVILNVIKNNNSWKIDSIDIKDLERIKKDVSDYWISKGKENPKRFNK